VTCARNRKVAPVRSDGVFSETCTRMSMKCGIRWQTVKVEQRLAVTRIVQGRIQILLGHKSFCLKHLSILRIINEKWGNNL